MTQEERNLLNDLATKIAQTQAPPKDPEAEEFIRTRIGSRPDALYLMTQTVLVQNLALQNAQQQIQDLQARLGQQPASPASSGSFLGGAPRAQGYGTPSQQQYSPQYAPPSPQYAQPPSPGLSGGGGGGGGFLRGAAQTAAGVAAGTLAAEAIGSMFSHHGGGFGPFGGSGLMGGAPVEETVVNNYYDSPPDDLRVDDRGRESLAEPGEYDNTQYDDNVADDSIDDGGGFDDSNDDSFA
jgi:hypothetical protein